MFDSGPVGDVAADDGLVGEPLGGVLVGFLPVGAGGDGDQGAFVAEVVGVGFASLVGPLGGVGVPGFGEGDEVVDVQGAGNLDVLVVVPGVPASAVQGAAAGDFGCGDGFLEEDFVAGGAAVSVGVGPVVEQVAVVTGAVLVGDLEGGHGVAQWQGVGGVPGEWR